MSEAGKPLAARLAEEAREARLRELQPRDAGAALVRTISARERTRTAAAQALAASFEDEAARAKLEVNFIDYIVQPLWTNIVIRFPESAVCLTNLDVNKKYYLAQLNNG